MASAVAADAVTDDEDFKCLWRHIHLLQKGSQPRILENLPSRALLEQL